MTTPHRKLVLLGTAIAGVLAVGGCVTAGSPSTGEAGIFTGVSVVERSRVEPPPWTNLAPSHLVSDRNEGGAYRMNYEQSKLGDLANGLKDSQLAALETSKKAFADVGRTVLAERAADLGLARTGFRDGQNPEFERILADVVRETHGRHAKVADIYFEKFANEHPTKDLPAQFFKAWVLVQLPRQAFPDLMSASAVKLKAARDPKLRSLGQSLLQSGKEAPRAPDLSH